jgi:hypothetical protein
VGGFRSRSFDCKTGSQSHRGLRFPKPPPIIPDGQISRVRFETLAFLPQAFPSLERFKRWSVYTPAILVCLRPRLMTCSWRYAGFIKPTAIRPRKAPSVLSPFAQLRCYLRWGDVSTISSEGVTPPSSLLRAHVPLPLGSLLLRHLASFGESGRLYAAPAAHGSFPTLSLKVFSQMLDPMPRRYTVRSHLFLTRCHRPSPNSDGLASRVCSTNNDFS